MEKIEVNSTPRTRIPLAALPTSPEDMPRRPRTRRPPPPSRAVVCPRALRRRRCSMSSLASRRRAPPPELARLCPSLSLSHASLPPLNPPALSSRAQKTGGPHHGVARPAPSPVVHGAPRPGLIPCLVGALLSRPDPASPSPRRSLSSLGESLGNRLRRWIWPVQSILTRSPRPCWRPVCLFHFSGFRLTRFRVFWFTLVDWGFNSAVCRSVVHDVVDVLRNLRDEAARGRIQRRGGWNRWLSSSSARGSWTYSLISCSSMPLPATHAPEEAQHQDYLLVICASHEHRTARHEDFLLKNRPWARVAFFRVMMLHRHLSVAREHKSPAAAAAAGVFLGP